MTLYNFFRKFSNLLRLEGKAHDILPQGIHRNICDYKVYLFWTHKFFILILIEHSDNKIIMCFVVQQTRTLQEFSTTRTESRNSWWLMLDAFGIFECLC